MGDKPETPQPSVSDCVSVAQAAPHVPDSEMPELVANDSITVVALESAQASNVKPACGFANSQSCYSLLDGPSDHR